MSEFHRIMEPTPPAAMFQTTSRPKQPVVIVQEFPLIYTGVCNDCGESWTEEQPKVDYAKLDNKARLFIKNTSSCAACRKKYQDELAEYEQQYREVRLANQRTEFILSSGIRGKYTEEDRDLAHFETRGMFERQLAECHRWLEQFDIEQPRGASSIVFFSKGFGTGKTHLATSLLKAGLNKTVKVRDSRYNPIHFTTAETALRHVHAGQSFSAEEKEEDVYRRYTTVPLLCLDDVGKEAPSKDQASFYYSVINGRYDLELPVILTANVEKATDIAQAVGGAAMSRLQDMAAGFWIDMNGQDYRPIDAQRKAH